MDGLQFFSYIILQPLFTDTINNTTALQIGYPYILQCPSIKTNCFLHADEEQDEE